MLILQTERLALRQANLADAPFIFDLLTDKTFIDNIADKGVKTLKDAENYIQQALLDSYEKNGFGLYITELKGDSTPVGICGLVKRDSLDCPDVGYAFLPKFTGQGFATESAQAVIKYGNDTLNLPRIVGITAPDNESSIRVLEKIGLVRDKMVSHDGIENILFVPQ